MGEVCDGIILGSGHNSLILQAYLGQAGLQVLCLEARDTPGGGLCTMEDPRHAGFRHNTHSFFHRAIQQMPWYRDLDLESRGAIYLEPALNTAMVLRDGRVLGWWTDFERTVESFRQFSEADARTLVRWREAFKPIVEKILIPESQSPPLPPKRRRALLQRSKEGRLLLEVSALSPLEFVQQHFENPVIQAGLLFFNGLREVDLRCRGFGHHIAQLLASAGKAQMAVGGSAVLARALVRSVEAHGGQVHCGVSINRIIVEHGRAVAVQTGDGQIIRARKFVASGLNPQQTFLDLMDQGDVPDDWRAKANGFAYNLIAPLFGLNLNLTEPPCYQAAADMPELSDAFMVILGLEDLKQYPQIVKHHERGTIPPTVMWGCCPTRFDPSQAPPGAHTAFMWEKLPFALHGDAANWDREREAHGQVMLDVWRTYAPNLDGETVIDAFTRSPLDTQRTLANMQRGDLLVGAFTNDQVGYHRPFPGAGHYRTHLPNLYLCGSCCHPGGNITGLVGYNAAQVVLADLGLPAPWAPPSIEARLEALS